VLPTLVVDGAPRTKKTSSRLIPKKGSRKCPSCGQFDQHLIIPSSGNEEWFKAAMQQSPILRTTLLRKGISLPITQYVNVRALFYRDRLTGDATGYYQALADYLQAPRQKDGKTTRHGAGIIDDDALIASWDGSRLLKDAANPRIEVTITVLLDEQMLLSLVEEW
jgi:hypothetical protein